MVVVTKYQGERNRTVARLRSARKDRRIRGIMCKKEKGKGVVIPPNISSPNNKHFLSLGYYEYHYFWTCPLG